MKPEYFIQELIEMVDEVRLEVILEELASLTKDGI